MAQNAFSHSPPQYFLPEQEMVLLTHNKDIQIGYKSGITIVPASHLWYCDTVQAVGKAKRIFGGFFGFLQELQSKQGIYLTRQLCFLSDLKSKAKEH